MPAFFYDKKNSKKPKISESVSCGFISGNSRRNENRITIVRPFIALHSCTLRSAKIDVQ